jgi:hypothetical protein
MTRPPTLLRLAAIASALTGLAHLLVPDLLLRAAEVGYDRVLAVDFDPRENSTRRVRLLGLLALALAWALWRGAAVFED